jgi:enoyl-CoA hydratase/carnithine racemase
MALDVSRQGDALVLRVRNEDHANALDAETLSDLREALGTPGVCDVRVVLLAGAGDRHFCSGLDLGADGDALRAGARVEVLERHLGAAVRAIAGCDRPVIGVVNGAAVGGGLELALACDWRIARRGAKLAMPAARIGVVYSRDGLARFVATIGPAQTRRLFLTGRVFDADAGLAMGLVDEVVDPDELWPAAFAAAAEVAEGDALAIDGTREIVRDLTRTRDDPAAAAKADEWRKRAFAVRAARAARATDEDRAES